MNVRQWLALAAGLAMLAYVGLEWPCVIPGGLILDGFDRAWLGRIPASSNWTYLPRLHAAELAFVPLATGLFVALLGDRTNTRQKEAGWLAAMGVALMGVVWFPASLGGLVLGFADQFIADIDVLLVITLAFVFQLRGDS